MPALFGCSFKTRLFYLISELLDFLCKTWQYTLFFQLQHSQPQWKGAFEILKTIRHRLFAIGTKVIAQEHLKKLSWELLITHIHLDSSDITEQSLCIPLLLILLLLVLVYVVYIPPQSPKKNEKSAQRDINTAHWLY